MARKMKEAGPGIGHNIETRQTLIRQTFAEIYKIEGEIDDLREQHITPLAKSKTKRWRELKKALDIPRNIMEAEYRVYKLARRAQENTEDDSGALTLDNLREVFTALHPGGQLDWVAALQQAA